MFSTTTMESSTSRPSESTRPAIESWFSEKPVTLRSAMPTASESGIDTMTMAAARSPSGSSVMLTRLTAIAKSI